MAEHRTQVGIVGAGPAGLLLSHLLQREGIETVVLEARSRAYVEQRIRAGVLEHQTADLLRSLGLGGRMDRQGLVHEGIELRFADRIHRVDFSQLIGRSVMVYGQHEVVMDLIRARLAAHGDLRFEAKVTGLSDVTNGPPEIRFEQSGVEHTLRCDFVAGCDGFHGACRSAIPESAVTVQQRTYPFAWLGILANAPPPSKEIVYARHPRGFALASMRSPEISRMYLQCAPDENPESWSDARIWDELSTRLAVSEGAPVVPGDITQKSITALRASVLSPMRWGRLFLAGDAAHIVPPTGAKGMNLAVADVCVLAEALTDQIKQNRSARLVSYSDVCLARIWKAMRFSNWMTTHLHVDPRDSDFEDAVKRAELDYVVTSRAAATALAENYVGLPLHV